MIISCASLKRARLSSIGALKGTPDPEVEPPTRKIVEHRELFGDPYRVIQTDEPYPRAEPDSACALCRRSRQDRHRRNRAAVGEKVMLGEPNRVEAVAVGELDLFENVTVELLKRGAL